MTADAVVDQVKARRHTGTQTNLLGAEREAGQSDVIAAISGPRADWDHVAAGADTAITRRRVVALCRMQYTE